MALQFVLRPLHHHHLLPLLVSVTIILTELTVHRILSLEHSPENAVTAFNHLVLLVNLFVLVQFYNVAIVTKLIVELDMEHLVAFLVLLVPHLLPLLVSVTITHQTLLIVIKILLGGLSENVATVQHLLVQVVYLNVLVRNYNVV